MRSEVEGAYEQGGEISPPDRPGLKSFEEMKQRVLGRVKTPGGGTRMVVMTPEGEVRYVNEEPTPMSKWELHRSARKEMDPKDLEAEANQRSLMAGEEGGRIEVYAGGAMEWVPNGPGGVPQPTTGDVFFDPIAEEQQKMQGDANMKQLMQRMIAQGVVHKPGRKKFARGGAVRNFPDGGLVEEYEETAIPVNQLIERAVDPTPGQSLQSMIIEHRDQALERLRVGQTAMQTRHAEQRKEAQRAKWFALAQGMLAPTQTGGFGESLGATAGLMRQESALRQQQEQGMAEEALAYQEQETEIGTGAIEQLTDVEESQYRAGIASRARVAGQTKIYNQDDLRAFRAGEENPRTGEKWKRQDMRINWVNAKLMPDGTTQYEIAGSPGEEPFQIVDEKSDPALAALLAAATKSGSMGTENIIMDARAGLDVMQKVRNYQKASILLRNLVNDPSGLREKVRTFANFLGLSEALVPDHTPLARLQALYGEVVLDDLGRLTGTKSNFEYKKVEANNANLGQNIADNMGIIMDDLAAIQRVIDEGEFAANALTGIPGINQAYMLSRYSRFRTEQKQMQASQEKDSRVPVPGASEILIQQIQDLGPTGTKEDHDKIMKVFTETKGWDIPDETKIELRKLGVGI